MPAGPQERSPNPQRRHDGDTSHFCRRHGRSPFFPKPNIITRRAYRSTGPTCRRHTCLLNAVFCLTQRSRLPAPLRKSPETHRSTVLVFRFSPRPRPSPSPRTGVHAKNPLRNPVASIPIFSLLLRHLNETVKEIIDALQSTYSLMSNLRKKKFAEERIPPSQKKSSIYGLKFYSVFYCDKRVGNQVSFSHSQPSQPPEARITQALSVSVTVGRLGLPVGSAAKTVAVPRNRQTHRPKIHRQWGKVIYQSPR